jgi:hypothetical protein
MFNPSHHSYNLYFYKNTHKISLDGMYVVPVESRVKGIENPGCICTFLLCLFMVSFPIWVVPAGCIGLPIN